MIFSALKFCIDLEIYIGEAYETDDGLVFIKFNSEADALPMFSGEFASLAAIRNTRTIYTPKPLCIAADPANNGGAFVMEFLNLKPIDQWEKMGSDLADLHLFNSILGQKKEKLSSWIGKPPSSSLPGDIDISMQKELKLKISDDLIEETEYVDQFGFDTTTCCGRIPQNNEWHDNWIEFFARNRLKQQVDLIVEKDGDREVVEYWSGLQLKVDVFFRDLKQPIVPSLLHGDLWSGNVSQTDLGPVVFDPASFYGHSELELSIAALFGGFDPQFYSAYFKKIPKANGFEM